MKGIRRGIGVSSGSAWSNVPSWSHRWTDMDGSSSTMSSTVLLMDLSPEALTVSWDWIAARRDPNKTLEECLALAPTSWRRWVEQGNAVKEQVRQTITRARTFPPPNKDPTRERRQKPRSASLSITTSASVLYEGVGEHRFEGLASEIAGAVLRQSGQYRPGWITKRAGDGGIDFVSRLDLGAGSGSLKLVVLGQAKCIAGNAPVTSGLDLARTVARLDRGWIGAFVTTGYFSDQAQREVVADRFPLLMLNGRHVGETVVKEAALRGVTAARVCDERRPGIRRPAIEPPADRHS